MMMTRAQIEEKINEARLRRDRSIKMGNDVAEAYNQGRIHAFQDVLDEPEEYRPSNSATKEAQDAND